MLLPGYDANVVPTHMVFGKIQDQIQKYIQLEMERKRERERERERERGREGGREREERGGIPQLEEHIHQLQSDLLYQCTF